MRWVVARSRSESLSRACVGDQVGGGTILAIPNCSTSGRILRKYLNGSDHSCSDGRSVGPSTHLSASSRVVEFNSGFNKSSWNAISELAVYELANCARLNNSYAAVCLRNSLTRATRRSSI